MQADGGFVQDVEDTHQARADLGGKPDPLGLPAGEGPSGASQVQVVHSHVQQKGQAVPDLLEYPFGDDRFLARKRQGRKELHAFPNG
ncbi:MAG: hypothetical protein A4E66_02531 [Syntrophus sp. PtaB.Bin001]|nr:MAG: hypothetical protein A4E66_02531 [Syntrophus sp. PtaB.Bin001]